MFTQSFTVILVASVLFLAAGCGGGGKKSVTPSKTGETASGEGGSGSVKGDGGNVKNEGGSVEGGSVGVEGGGVESGGGPGGDEGCVWDSSQWDNCHWK